MLCRRVYRPCSSAFLHPERICRAVCVSVSQMGHLSLVCVDTPHLRRDTLVGSGVSVSTEAVNRDSDSLLRLHRAAAKSLARSASVAKRNHLPATEVRLCTASERCLSYSLSISRRTLL